MNTLLKNVLYEGSSFFNFTVVSTEHFDHVTYNETNLDYVSSTLKKSTKPNGKSMCVGKSSSLKVSGICFLWQVNIRVTALTFHYNVFSY